ncbi:hypothetical protein VTK73DRAFT_5257 [Phialemonium thermophilum]|uniref:Uncharacterized protein n=1 Tax=Phialemonium thermophilum TaxID=223376 RepID=A0ABR3V2J7_9PEZI
MVQLPVQEIGLVCLHGNVIRRPAASATVAAALVLGAESDDVGEVVDGPSGQLAGIQVCEVAIGLPEGEGLPLLTKRRPDVLAQPRPPDGLPQAVGVAVDYLGALDPEDALEVLLPVRIGAVQHLVRRDDEGAGQQLQADLVAGVLHRLAAVVQRAVVVANGVVGRWTEAARVGRGVTVHDAQVARREGENGVHKPDVVQLRFVMRHRPGKETTSRSRYLQRDGGPSSQTVSAARRDPS